jgi:hypothetical protein
MRRPGGVTLIAIFHFVIGVLDLLGALGILLFAFFPVANANAGPRGIAWAVFGLGCALLIVVGWALVSFVAGLGLLRLKEWARLLTIGIAVLSLVLFPVGTVIGGAIVWYLVQGDVVAAFHGNERGY